MMQPNVLRCDYVRMYVRMSVGMYKYFRVEGVKLNTDNL